MKGNQEREQVNDPIRRLSLVPNVYLALFGLQGVAWIALAGVALWAFSAIRSEQAEYNRGQTELLKSQSEAVMRLVDAYGTQASKDIEQIRAEVKTLTWVEQQTQLRLVEKGLWNFNKNPPPIIALQPDTKKEKP